MAARSTQRRERLRQATRDEIRATARRILVERGTAAVTVNAVAREMGVSGPALYHYYAGQAELFDALVADFYHELTAAMTAARDARPQASPTGRLLAVCRALRAWVVAHPVEFHWIFTRPVPSVGAPAEDSSRGRAGAEFENVFLDEFVALWQDAPFPTPELGSLSPELRAQLRAYTVSRGGRLPPEAAHVFLTSWTRVYGLLCLEALRQLDFAFTDLEPMFEQTLRDLTGDLGGTYTPPGS